jgi:hypothetical protein
MRRRWVVEGDRPFLRKLKKVRELDRLHSVWKARMLQKRAVAFMDHEEVVGSVRIRPSCSRE